MPSLSEWTINQAIELLEDIINMHTDPNSCDYNECEKDQCAWCELATAIIKDFRTAVYHFTIFQGEAT